MVQRGRVHVRVDAHRVRGVCEVDTDGIYKHQPQHDVLQRATLQLGSIEPRLVVRRRGSRSVALILERVLARLRLRLRTLLPPQQPQWLLLLLLLLRRRRRRLRLLLRLPHAPCCRACRIA